MDDTRQEQLADSAPQTYHIAGTLKGDTVRAINSGRLDAEDIQTLLSMTREFPWEAVGDTASTEMSRLHDVSVQQRKRITELEAKLKAVTEWPDDPYLYGEKPDPCLYRQMPENFAETNERVFQHGDHLTREGLRGKWEIAAELAWRNEQIAELEAWKGEALELLGLAVVPAVEYDEEHNWCERRKALLAQENGK